MLLDTSVLVDIDRGNTERVERLPDEWHAISSATFMEVSVGKYKNAIRDEALQKLTDNLEILPINQAVADNSAEIFTQLSKQGEKIGLNDTYIAATAVIYGKTLLTADTAHFDRVEELTVRDWNSI